MARGFTVNPDLEDEPGVLERAAAVHRRFAAAEAAPAWAYRTATSPTDLTEDLPDPIERLRRSSREALAARCGDAAAPLAERFAAGALLAQIGDPRISTLDPPMVEDTGGRAEIGLDVEQLDAVLQAAPRS